MSTLTDAKEKWTGTISTLVIGATREEGGTRTSKVTVGGSGTLPFMRFEGSASSRPAVAVEIWDTPPDDWAAPLTAAWGDACTSSQ